MPTRQNPFYQFRNPAIGQAFNGLASVFAQQPDARAQASMAQADANTALANYRGEQTRGERDKNSAAVTNPQALAELLMSGGVLRDDPLQANPDFAPRPPTDYSLMAPTPTGDIASAFMPMATAQDKMAAAIQEANIRGMSLADVLKAAGVSEFQRRAFGDAPDTALAAGPFVGLNPNQNTALTTTGQDRISARDAAEDLTKQGTINATNLERERLQQGGANARQQFTTLNAPVVAGNNADVMLTPARAQALGLAPDEQGRYVVRGRSTVGTGQSQQPGSLGGEEVKAQARSAGGGSGSAAKLASVPKAASDRMTTIIKDAMTKSGMKPAPEVMTGLLAEAGRVWQDNKNPDAAADDVVQRVLSGQTVNGVSMKTTPRTLRPDQRTLQRAPAGSDPLAAARDAIGRGADRAAVIKRLQDNGIDATGL
jgi:hypothetical protein